MAGTILENEELSANTLFNFTKKRKFLLLNLKRKFRPRLVLEDYGPILSLPYKMAAPMTCFCDIRLSNISTHIKEYGNYGIGLKKEWGIAKGLNPVHYITSDSSFFDSFANMVKDLKSNTDSFMNVFVFFKPYKGMQNKKMRNFYNEREWRYIPKDIDIQTMLLRKKAYNDIAIRTKINEILEKPEYSLDFSFSDIKYIVIKEDSDKKTVIKKMRKTATAEEIAHITFITKNMIDNDI